MTLSQCPSCGNACRRWTYPEALLPRYGGRVHIAEECDHCGHHSPLTYGQWSNLPGNVSGAMTATVTVVPEYRTGLASSAWWSVVVPVSTHVEPFAQIRHHTQTGDGGNGSRGGSSGEMVTLTGDQWADVRGFVASDAPGPLLDYLSEQFDDGSGFAAMLRQCVRERCRTAEVAAV